MRPKKIWKQNQAALVLWWRTKKRIPGDKKLIPYWLLLWCNKDINGLWDTHVRKIHDDVMYWVESLGRTDDMMMLSGSSAIIKQKKYLKFLSLSTYTICLPFSRGPVHIRNEWKYSANNIGITGWGKEWRPREYIHTRMDVHGGRRGKRRTRGRSKRHHQRTILKR